MKQPQHKSTPKPAHQPTWRKPAGILLMLVYIALWSFIIASNWEYIAMTHILVQALIYLILGVIWIFPLKPLMIWMETGKWRA